MRILIVRHGEPDYAHDTLTEKGWREAELLSERLCKEKIDDFYVSPLGRAKDTASLTLKKMNREAVVLDWLEEFTPKIKRPDVKLHRTVAWDWLPGDWTVDERFYDKDHWFENPVFQEAHVKEAYDAVVNAKAENFESASVAIEESYKNNVTDEFDCTYLYDTAGPSPRVSLHIEGANPNKSKINIRPGGNITNKPLFNCTGVNNGTFRNFSVNCDSTVSPYCVFLLMRNDTNTNAGGNTFENIVCLNLYFKYQYLIIGSENDVFIHCNGSVFLDSYVPDENIISDYYIRYDLVDGGCTRNSFFRCDFTSLYLGSGITNTSFIGCYTNREIRCIRSSSNVTFIDIRDETPNDLPATLIIEENVSISNYFIYGSLRKGVLGKKGSTLINCSIKNAAILTSGTSDEIDEDIPTGCCFYLYNSYSSTYQAVGGSVIIRNNGFGNITSNYITHNSIFETDGSDIKYLYLNNKNAIKHINYPARATLYDFNHLLKLGALSYDNEIINIEEDSVITLDPLSSSVKIINLSANVTGISLVSSAYNKGSYYKFIFVQDSIGGHIVNLYNATIKGNLPYVNTDPNSITVIELLELNNTFYFIYSNDIIKSTIDSIDGVSRGNFNSKLLYNGDNHLYSFCKDNNVFNLSIVEPSRIKFISYDDVNDSVFSTANTTYKIIGNVDLKGKTYNIGNNCKIDLSDGGFIQNGTIVLNNTVIYPTGLDLSIFMPNVTIEGNFIKGQSILDGISKRIKIWDGVNWFTANGENYSDIRGNTESRPTNINQGYCYYDTTLNKPIWWTGSKWIDATGTNV